MTMTERKAPGRIITEEARAKGQLIRWRNYRRRRLLETADEMAARGDISEAELWQIRSALGPAPARRAG